MKELKLFLSFLFLAAFLLIFGYGIQTYVLFLNGNSVVFYGMQISASDFTYYGKHFILAIISISVIVSFQVIILLSISVFKLENND